MFVDEARRNADVGKRDAGEIYFGRLFAQPGFSEISAIERTVDRILTLGTATNRANFSPYSGTIAAGCPHLANNTFHGGRRHLHRIIEVMARIDLYVKIDLDLPDSEQPEKLAAEICRQIRKVYGVRAAEVQNMVEQSS